MSSVRLTVLGSGTLLPNDDHRSSCYLLESRPGASGPDAPSEERVSSGPDQPADASEGDTNGFRCLLDCGSGALHGLDRWGLPWEELDAVVFSHYHVDHVGDLASLMFALQYGPRPPRTRPLAIVGPPGLERMLDGIATAFGKCVDERSFPFVVDELGRTGTWDAARSSAAAGVETARGPTPTRVEFHPTPHTDGSVAHRWHVGERVIAYTGDSGPPDDELVAFLADADLLIAECALPDGTDMRNHLTPSLVAALAERARPRLLLTTHVYPPLEPSEIPDHVHEAGYGGEVEAARDGLVIEVGEDHSGVVDVA